MQDFNTGHSGIANNLAQAERPAEVPRLERAANRVTALVDELEKMLLAGHTRVDVFAGPAETTGAIEGGPPDARLLHKVPQDSSHIRRIEDALNRLEGLTHRGLRTLVQRLYQL